MAFPGKKVMIKITSDSIFVEGEDFITSDDMVYRIQDSDKEIWDAFEDITVYDNGVAVDETEYELNRLKGMIIFETAESRVITADLHYLPTEVVGEAFEFSYSLEAENADSTTFGNDFVSRKQTLKEVNGNLSKFTELDGMFFDLLNNEIVAVIEFYYHEGIHYDTRVRCLLSSKEVSATVEDLVESEIEFESVTDNEGRSVAFKNDVSLFSNMGTFSQLEGEIDEVV